MEEDFISLKELSNSIKLDRSNTRKIVLKYGIKPQKRRTIDSGNQLTLTITKSEANYIVEKRRENGFLNSSKAVVGDIGVFYIIQLIPELEPNRIKLGFSEDINSRLSQHRTASPTAIVLKIWPCKRSWESTVMDCLSSYNCKLILNEVYECSSINEIITIGDRLFAILPDPIKKVDISKHSPFQNKKE